MAKQIADSFTVLSWNVRGLNSKFNRALLFQYLKSNCPQLILLQETHLLGSKNLPLKKTWVQKAKHATYSTYARGVTILIHKNVPCVIEEICTDPQGKFALVVFTLWAQKYIVVNIYVPPPFSPVVLYTILERITPFCPGKILILGDFNATMSPDLDRPTPSKNHSIELSAWAQAMGLAEIWRWKHPTTRSYSCFSVSHKTASRIDLAFSNPSLMADVLEASYLTSGLSDHSPLAVVLRSPTTSSAALWRLGPH